MDKVRFYCPKCGYVSDLMSRKNAEAHIERMLADVTNAHEGVHIIEPGEEIPDA